MSISNKEPQDALSVAVGAFVDELVRAGVRHFCVCPGSRSTPLALMLTQYPAIQIWMHLDERSAAFFGLGLAKTLHEPVALVCTSGTAAANFLPAVTEAYYSRIPLIVLTADRPHELRDVGAPQAIDQVHLFGAHVKWFTDLAEPDASPLMLRYVRTIANRAVATARRGPAGPVHINCLYREPLMPNFANARAAPTARAEQRPYVAVKAGLRAPTAEIVAALSADCAAIARGLIICGPQDDPELAAAVTQLANALGYPILADPLSGLRTGPHDHTLVVDSYDAFLRDNTLIEQLAPELVLRFGAMPVSKPLLLYLQRYADCRQIVIDGDAGWNEPTLLAADMIHTDGRLLCTAMQQFTPSIKRDHSEWTAAWRRAERQTRTAINTYFAALDELFEGKVFAELAELLPDNALLFAGNSMPVRDMDTFFYGSTRTVRLLANRGANGIDGVVSSALGASVANAGPTVLAIGDISFYHDSNGLFAALRHQLNTTIVLLNNDGGGIFSFLAQANEPEHFETLFGTPHGLDFRPLAAMYGAHYEQVHDWATFRSALQRAISSTGLKIIEVPTNRNRNVTLHREIWKVVSAALARHEI